MKFQQRKRVIQKLWGWISLSINCLVITTFLQEKITGLLTKGILLSVLILCYGVVKTRADKRKDDLSGVSVLIEYICVYIITFLSAFKVIVYLSSISLLLALTITSVIELLVFLFITYWRTIQTVFTQRNKGKRRNRFN